MPTRPTIDALVEACASGDELRVRGLLAEGVLPNMRGEDGRTPLGAAADMGWEDVVSVLLRHGAKTELGDREGLTPLALATRRHRRHGRCPGRDAHPSAHRPGAG